MPAADAQALAEQFPEITLRVEPAHREAYVALGRGRSGSRRTGGQRSLDQPRNLVSMVRAVRQKVVPQLSYEGPRISTCPLPDAGHGFWFQDAEPCVAAFVKEGG